MAHAFPTHIEKYCFRVPPSDTGQGSPVGVGVPYWTTATEGGGSSGSGGRNEFSDPDPLSVSDLPAPLVPFEEFLGGDGGSVSGGGGGDGGGGRQEGPGRERPGEGEEVVEIDFEPTAFDHPVFIMFSSGTTGLPKCMVHGAGGEMLMSSDGCLRWTRCLFRYSVPLIVGQFRVSAFFLSTVQVFPCFLHA